jgi:D-alanine-D-alanine ligase
VIHELFGQWGKIVVKPAGCGSTVGVSIVDDPARFNEAFERAGAYDDAVVAEKYIPGKEITVTVWQELESPEAFPAIEIRPKTGFYTYEAKYVPGHTEYFCPAPMTERTASAVEEAAMNAHSALDCRIYSRVDLRLSPEGGPFVLEVNTAPGMTATSLVPKAAEAFGWTFPELCARIVSNSLEAAKRGALHR